MTATRSNQSRRGTTRGVFLSRLFLLVLVVAIGWSAWVYQQIGETYVLDADMRARLASLNPVASARMARRLIEACDRNYWTPDAATLAALHQASDELEDGLEGVATAA